MMANTADAAPRRPANAVRACCLQEERKGVITRNTATGLAINVSPRKMSRAVPSMGRSMEGNTRSPSRKKISICASRSMLSCMQRDHCFRSLLPGEEQCRIHAGAELRQPYVPGSVVLEQRADWRDSVRDKPDIEKWIDKAGLLL